MFPSHDPLVTLDSASGITKLQALATTDDHELFNVWTNTTITYTIGKGREPLFIYPDDLGRFESYGNIIVLAAGDFVQVASETIRNVGYLTVSTVIRFYEPLLLELTDQLADYTDPVPSGTSLSVAFGAAPVEGQYMRFDGPTTYFPMQDGYIARLMCANDWLTSNGARS